MEIRKTYKYLKIIVPCVLLFLVLRNIDFSELKLVFRNAEFSLIVVALLFFPIQFLVSIIRWKILLKRFGNSNKSIWSLMRIYYEGIFIGYFVPAGLGIDTYRVLNTDKDGKGYILNISIILMEKISGLIASGLCVLFFGLFISVSNEIVRKIIIYSNIILVVIIVGLIISYLLRKNHIVHRFNQQKTI